MMSSPAINLAQALQLARAAEGRDGDTFAVFLAMGSEPLHMATFLKAGLAERLPDRPVSVETGLFGDLAGNIERAAEAGHGNLAVLIEWSDLDPRLGHRALGGWGLQHQADIVVECERSAARIADRLRQGARSSRIVVSLPTLPPAPVFHHHPGELGTQQAAIRRVLAGLAEDLAAERRIAVLSGEGFHEASEDGTAAHDLKSEFMTGFPYGLAHAARLAGALVEALCPPVPKKGLISDLDNCLWRGIAGEDGPEAVAWTLESGAQIHGLYQLLLTSLAETGVLVAIASKNSPDVVDQVFARPGICFAKDAAFPVEVHWGRKSESVKRILRSWNIGADSVLFLDDSDMELAEVKSAFPDMECAKFPLGDDREALALLWRLRDLFGRDEISEEDRIRTQGLRRGLSAVAPPTGGTPDDAFLEGLDQRLHLTFGADPDDRRAFELLNKTNQFNLNGRRYTESDWLAFLDRDDAVMVTAEYEDKFGPLGKIAVLGGERRGDAMRLDFWVMSCRAFSRNIEHACLQSLFDRLGIEVIDCDYAETDRNIPLQNFLRSILGSGGIAPASIEHRGFEERRPPLHHVLEIVDHGR